MIHIEKHFDSSEVVAYEAELKENLLDKESLADDSVHQSLKGPDVYDQVKSFLTFESLKIRMFADQGGICCYCGCRLQYPNHPQYIVEHVRPKEKYRTLAGEYENLLLSCRPTDEEEKNRMAAGRRERKMFFHCDKAKASKELAYTPLMDDCQKYFEYDEFGGIAGIDTVAEKDIETLNLKCEWLRKRRAAAIDGELYDEDGNLLSDEELRSRLSTIMQVDEDGKHSEFCFVIRSVINGLLER